MSSIRLEFSRWRSFTDPERITWIHYDTEKEKINKLNSPDDINPLRKDVPEIWECPNRRSVFTTKIDRCETSLVQWKGIEVACCEECKPVLRKKSENHLWNSPPGKKEKKILMFSQVLFNGTVNFFYNLHCHWITFNRISRNIAMRISR